MRQDISTTEPDRRPRKATAPGPPPLGYLPLAERPLRRLPQLFLGLTLYGGSLALMVRAGLGLSPWSVLNEGLARRTGLSFGTLTGLVGALVLLLWLPLRQRPTFGTFANIVVLAGSSDLGLRLLPQHLGLPARIGLLAGGVLLNAFAIAVYVGARCGPGPRDGLMTGASAATGRSLRLVRTLIEIGVLVVGRLLGGSVGAGTVLYALAVGPTTQFFLPWFVYRSPAEGGRFSPRSLRPRRGSPGGPSRPGSSRWVRRPRTSARSGSGPGTSR